MSGIDTVLIDLDGIRRGLLIEKAEMERLRERCAICGHEWSRHDPEDGRCDAGSAPGEPFGVCECGRDLGWMQTKIAAMSRAALEQGLSESRS